MHKVLLLGHSGQLASEIRAKLPAAVQLKVLSYSTFSSLADDELKTFFTSFEPDWVINVLAYNKVDQAELFPELALAGNLYLVQRIQRLCALTPSRLIHISTDYVFDGLKNEPYTENDLAQPLNEYGKSKRAAELWLLQYYADRSVIIRTSWLYSFFGSNFVKTMLQLMRAKHPLRIVSDQVGSPCWARGLANAIWHIVLQSKISSGIYHWADSGYCSRYEFADEIQTIALDLGVLSHKVEIEAIHSEQLNRKAVRPAFSALDSKSLRVQLGLLEIDWKPQLAQALTLFLPAEVIRDK